MAYDIFSAGFDDFLNRGMDVDGELLDDESRTFISQLSGSTLASGISRSPDGKLVIDWDRGEIQASDLARNRVLLGNLRGLGEYGIRVLDRVGATKFEASSALQYIGIIGNQVTVSPDVTSDDFTNIQTAIDYINELGGGVVFIKTGTYTISSDITLYSNISLIGESLSSSIIDFADGTNNISTDNEATNVRFSNLTIKNCQNTTNGTVYLDECTDGRMENIVFTDNKDSSDDGYDIKLKNVSRFVIDKVVSTGGATFMFGQGTGNGQISVNNCDVACANNAIWGEDINNFIQNVVFSNCRFNSDKSNLYGAIRDCSFKSCNLTVDSTNTQANIYFLIDSSRNFFSGCDISAEDDCEEVILIAPSAGGAVDNRFVGNRIIGGGENYDIVKLVSADRNIFLGNSISGGTGSSYAVNISNAACDNTVVVGNYLDGSTADTDDQGTGSVIDHNAT